MATQRDRRHLLAGLLLMTATIAAFIQWRPPPDATSQEEEITYLDLHTLPDFRIVEVHTDQAVGTGFFVSPDGLLVTANHVVSDARDDALDVIIGYWNAGLLLPGRVVARDEYADIALVQVEAGPLASRLVFESLPLETDATKRLASILPESEVTISGCPAGECAEGGIYTAEGSVDAITVEGIDVFAPKGITAGMSGSPVMNSAGRVVGVLSTSDTETVYKHTELEWSYGAGVSSIAAAVELLTTLQTSD